MARYTATQRAVSEMFSIGIGAPRVVGAPPRDSGARDQATRPMRRVRAARARALRRQPTKGAKKADPSGGSALSPRCADRSGAALILVSVDDPATGEVVGRHLDSNAVAGQNANPKAAHVSTERRQHGVRVAHGNAKGRVR